MFNNKQQQDRPFIKHFNCSIPLDRVVKHSYANAITVKNVQNDSNLILTALEMMAINNQVNLKVSVSKVAA